jgi:hypothetical protein
MNDNKEILKAIDGLKKEMHSMNNELKDDIFSLKEEMLLNRDDIRYVKQLRDVATVDDIVRLNDEVSKLKSFKDMATAIIIFAQFIYGFILWYVAKMM